MPAADDHSTIELAAAAVRPRADARRRGHPARVGQLVEAAIAKLPEQDAEIIIMRHYEQLSNQEIAQALGLTEPAASMRYLRAVRRLKELMTNPSGASANDGQEH